ncbi:MAG: class I SAM-dependent methyltransferase [Acidobacteriota bacterium]|nr:class I SAM-dependent methyltransferase [Acidobacteriota bacterium]
MNTPAQNTYDEFRYNNLPILQTHPSRLWVLAKLAGLAPAPVEKCRVLELGTSEAANIIGMAVTLPDAQFTGVDLAREPLARGQRVIDALGLDNVKLLRMNLLEIDESLGKFDYILTHGIYGWTPPEVGAKVLDIAQRCLTSDGIAFVSYNTHPSGHIRRLVREAMLYHAGRFENPVERLEHARAFLKVLALGRPQPDPFDAAAADYARILLEHTDSALFHDDLAPVYEPVYFHEFVAHAKAHGLQYAGEASGYDTPRNIRPEALEAVRGMAAGDAIAEQQYLDFLRMRGFRKSLLCRHERKLEAEWDAARIVGCYAATAANEDPDGAFSSADHIRLTTTHPVPIEYMRRLIESRPVPLQVGLEQAHVALELFKAGIIELQATPGIAVVAGDKPCASSLVRYQAANGLSPVTTLTHRAIEIEGEEARRMLTLLDGGRDRESLCSSMDCTRERLDTELRMLGRMGMLIA